LVVVFHYFFYLVFSCFSLSALIFIFLFWLFVVGFLSCVDGGNYVLKKIFNKIKHNITFGHFNNNIHQQQEENKVLTRQ
jgi:hypothetical protein